MKRSTSYPTLPSCPKTIPCINQKPNIKRNISVEVAMYNLTTSDVEYAATKVSVNQVLGCIISKEFEKFPKDIMSMDEAQIKDIASCMACPHEECELFSSNIPENIQRYLHLMRRKLYSKK